MQNEEHIDLRFGADGIPYIIIIVFCLLVVTFVDWIVIVENSIWKISHNDVISKRIEWELQKFMINYYFYNVD